MTLADRLLDVTALLSRQAIFDAVVLDQVAELDEKGNELQRGAGDAAVRYSYRVEGLPVFGPGAKTQVFCSTLDGSPRLTGAMHVWRELRASRDVKLESARDTLELALNDDPEVVRYADRGYGLTVDRLTFGYLALPAFVDQKHVFPAFQVECTMRGQRNERDYFHFGRYYHAVTAEEYRRADVFADYLVNAQLSAEWGTR
jgi:hypothetical protein